MLRPEEIRWTSRTAVCDQLTQLLLEIPQTTASDNSSEESSVLDREHALRLLIEISGHDCIPLLRRCLLDPHEEHPVRAVAFRALSAMKAVLSREDLEALLTDRPLREEECLFLFDHLFLPLCHSGEGLQVALRYLDGKSAEERADLLATFSHIDTLGDGTDAVSRVLLDWLYRRWLHEERAQLEGVRDRSSLVNLQVATSTRNRAESRVLLRQYWGRGARIDRRRVVLSLQPMFDLAERAWVFEDDQELLRELLDEYACSDPAGLQQIVEALELPLEFLLRLLGPDPLLRLIESKVEAADALFRCRRWADHDESIRRAFHLLLQWPDLSINGRIASRIICPDSSSGIRQQLFWVLWERDRERARDVAHQVATDRADTSVARMALGRIVRRPRRMDRDFLLWASGHQPNPEFRSQAIRGLEALGMDEPFWRKRLEELSQDTDAHVRLHANMVLVSRGNRNRLRDIEREAVSANDPRVRATAIQMLGELDAAQYSALFRRALFLDRRGTTCACCSPAPSAARALASLGTPEAMTTLLQDYLTTAREFYQTRELAEFVRRLDAGYNPSD